MIVECGETEECSGSQLISKVMTERTKTNEQC